MLYLYFYIHRQTLKKKDIKNQNRNSIRHFASVIQEVDMATIVTGG